jgi:hypothetical protein
VESIEKFLNKHLGLIQLAGGILATAISITVYAYTTFATKEEVRTSIQSIDTKLDILISNTTKKGR